MNTQEALEKYHAKMSLIILFQRRTNEAMIREVKRLAEPQKKNIFVHDYMSFISVNGELKYFDEKLSKKNDLVLFTIQQKNKQYQWLLVEAFESFETFLKEIYAIAGYVDNNVWMLKDFGETPLEEIQDKSFNWFLERSKKQHAREPARTILNTLRTAFPEIESSETNNHFKVNLKLALMLIMQLRNVIVHCSGEISDQEDFTKKVLQKAGLSESKYNRSFLNLFYTDIKIELFEVWHPVRLGTHNRLMHLFKILLAYADLLSEQITTLNTGSTE